MISVEVDLIPWGLVESRERLVTIAIWNDASGDKTTGNYVWAISHQHDSTYGKDAAKQTGIEHPEAMDITKPGPWVWKSGRVKGFARHRGAAALLAAVMKAAHL